MRLPALEKNILIYRALQMALFLFYSEALRRQLVYAVGREINKGGQPIKGEKLLKRIFRELESSSILTADESIEVQSLLQHRNTIAHQIHQLTGDIELPGRNYRFAAYLPRKYDYGALAKITHWHDALPDRLSKHYILTIGFDSLEFEAAAHAYERELETLRKRIDKQYVKRKQATPNESPNQEGAAAR